LSDRYYQGLRSPEYLHAQHLKLNSVYRELCTFQSHFSLNFTGFRDEDDLLRHVQSQLDEIAATGPKLKHLTTWKVVVFVREHWWHWLRVTLGNHPSGTTTTDNRSGFVSPRPHTPSRHATQSSSSSRPHNQSSTPSTTATQPPAPPSAGTGSSRGNRSNIPATPSIAPPGNPPVHSSASQAPPPPPSTVSTPRTTSASSSSQFRISRDSASARQARRLLPTGDLAATRPSRYLRAATQGPPATPFSSDAGSSAPRSVGAPRTQTTTTTTTTKSSHDRDSNAGAELVRQHRGFLDDVADVDEDDAEHDRVFRQAQVLIMRQMERNNARATIQSMRVERETAALAQVSARVQHASAQMAMANAAAATSQHLATQSFSLGNFDQMLVEARQQIEAEMGPLPSEEDLMTANAELPSFAPMPLARLSTSRHLPSPSVSYPRASDPPPQAGPSNYRNVPSSSGRFEDLGTIVGSPREELGSGEDGMEGVESLSIGGNYEEESEPDLEYVPRPPGCPTFLPPPFLPPCLMK
ncbi:hypothetical protein FRC08_009353, partial [Ceratobasidium sp. 394]